MDNTHSLQQLALRLSRLADGVDGSLDPLLHEIRCELKSDADAERIDELSSKLARTLLDGAGRDLDASDRADDRYDLSGLRSLIKSMPVQECQQKRMRELVTQIAEENREKPRQAALVQLLGTAGEALRDVANRDTNDGAVRRWLGRKSDTAGGNERYVSLFLDLLRRLVEHIDVFNGTEQQSQSIKKALEDTLHPEQANKLLKSVLAEIEAIDEQIRAERDQTTDFLGDLRERLTGFEEVLELLGDDSDGSLKRSEELQDEVGQDTRALGEAAKTEDVEGLRGLIGQGMARITERLAEHVLTERRQNETSKARVVELNERLEQLEEEAEVMRGEIRNKNDLVLKDTLTGIYNRAGYEARAGELYARWQRSGSALSMVFVDCNGFKQINDNFGHAAGDLVLAKVAEVLSGRARASDIVCRYGGDEFVILLPDTRSNGAEVFARSACEEIANAGFNDNGKPVHISVACGVTELCDGDTLECAVKRADDAMYKAKQLENLQVCVAA